MPETGDRITIDDQTYEVVGQVTFTEGSGEDATTWIFHGLRRESDDAEFYLEEEADPKYTLYGRIEDGVSAPALEEVDLERDLTSVDDDAFDWFAPDTKLVWGRVPSRLQAAPEPFTGTRSLMIYRGAGEQYARATFYGQKVVLDHELTFYSAIWPAELMERYTIPDPRIPTGLLPMNYAGALAVALAALTGAVPELGFDLVTSWFMWIGFGFWCATIFARSASFYVGAHIVASAYLIWFCTRGLDNYVMNNFPDDAGSLMAARIGGLIIAMALIRFGSRRVYYMLADGAKWGGSIAFSCYVVGLLIACMIEEYWYGRHFSWYVGDTPWGYIWPPILLIAVLVKVSDYLRVPMTHADFLAQLEQLRTACKGGAGVVQGDIARLQVIADDLGDSTNIADDPAIARLHNYNDTFFLIAKCIEALGTVDPNDLDLPRLTEDLQILADDLGDLVTLKGSEFPSIRISPQVRVLL